MLKCGAQLDTGDFYAKGKRSTISKELYYQKKDTKVVVKLGVRPHGVM